MKHKPPSNRIDELRLIMFLLGALSGVVGLIWQATAGPRNAASTPGGGVGSARARAVDVGVLEKNFASGHFAKKEAFFARPRQPDGRAAAAASRRRPSRRAR
jgi:hypothetical protein